MELSEIEDEIAEIKEGLEAARGGFIFMTDHQKVEADKRLTKLSMELSRIHMEAHRGRTS